jgi:hypothetical protein
VKSYRPQQPLEGAEWLAMSEGDRLLLVEQAHERNRWPAGENARVHASMHVIVENRLAAKDAPVVAAYDRCLSAGLDRHTTIHALASVVTAQLFRALQEGREYRAEDDGGFAELDPNEWR